MMAASALLLGGVGQARAGYVTIDPPGSTGTAATAIDGNNIVGYYETTTGANGQPLGVFD
jgi:hypothetical protein